MAATMQAIPLRGALPALAEGEYARLLEGADLTLGPESPEGLRLIPRGPEGDLIRAATTRPAGLFVESAFLLKGRLDGEAGRLRLFNALLGVKTLSGVTYYSERRGRETVLFDEVYRVAKVGSYDALADPSFRELPSSAAMTIHLKDSNFGDAWYLLECRSFGSGFQLSLENARPLGIFVVRAFEAGGFRMRLALLEVDEGILVVGVCAADPSPLAASMVDAFSAVEKRLRAVQKWVAGRLPAG
jgi:hypothetical protein